MKLLPLLVGIKFCHKAWRMPTIWIPIVLLWPFFFLFFFFVLVVGLVTLMILDARSVKQSLRFFGGIYTTFCELRGTQVDIENHENRILVLIH
jgi:hypothetical protein